MTQHWTVSELGEDMGECDPWEIIARLRDKLKPKATNIVALRLSRDLAIIEDARLKLTQKERAALVQIRRDFEALLEAPHADR